VVITAFRVHSLSNKNKKNHVWIQSQLLKCYQNLIS
jgi:hypothetical protein